MMINSAQAPSAKAGFSLLEISIILAIIAIMMTSILPLITDAMQDREREVTVERQQQIERAMLGYLAVNATLPCPASATIALRTSDFGVSANFTTGSPVGTCIDGSAPDANDETNTAHSGVTAVSYGMVPTRTLGLPDEMAFDGFGNRFSYYVSLTSVTSGTSGEIVLQDQNAVTKTSDAAYAVISHGQNGHGAYTLGGSSMRFSAGSTSSLEQENCDCTDSAAAKSSPDDFDRKGHIIVQAMTTGTGVNNYDDIVLARRLETMQMQIIRSGMITVDRAVGWTPGQPLP